MKAFLFPGQGSQYSGMADDFSKYTHWKEYSERANKIIGIDLTKIMNSEQETLKLTENAQPAIYLASYIAYLNLIDKNIYPDIVAGHSLGEYTAVAVSQVYTFGEGLYLVRKRGEYMSNSIEPNEGTMAAVLGTKSSDLEEIVKNYDGVHIANYNSTKQTVISGLKSSIEKFMKYAKNIGLKVIPLQVSAPFHTPYLEPAEKKMEKTVSKFEFRKPLYPIVMNSIAKPIYDANDIKHYLLKQISHPVYWLQSIKKMKEMGVTEFIEVGPKKVLTNMLRKDGYNIKHWTELI